LTTTPMMGPVSMPIPVLSSTYPHPAQLPQPHTQAQSNPTPTQAGDNHVPNSNANPNLNAHVHILPPLRGGDVLYWHHLRRSGEIPGVCEDERARSGVGVASRDMFRVRAGVDLDLKKGRKGGMGCGGGGVSGEEGKRSRGGFLVTPVGMVVGGR